MGRELRGSTLGVIGYGRIARYLCDLALAFGMRVQVSAPEAVDARDGLRQVALATLLKESHFVVCLAAAHAGTANLIDADAFAVDGARHLLRQCLARRAGRRGGAAGGTERRPSRRLRPRRRPRCRPDAEPGACAPSARPRDAARRRPDAAGDRAPGDGNGGAARGAAKGRDAAWRRQRGAGHAAGSMVPTRTSQGDNHDDSRSTEAPALHDAARPASSSWPAARWPSQARPCRRQRRRRPRPSSRCARRITSRRIIPGTRALRSSPGK